MNAWQEKELIAVYEKAPQFDIDGIRDFRKLAEFNGVIFGAKAIGSNGYEFSSWFKTHNGTGATIGDYSYDYVRSKQRFAERSCLVDSYRQFSDDELKMLHRCAEYTSEMDDKLDDKERKSINIILDKIELALLRKEN